ncbi:molybdopterin synthase catalytic subunit [Methylomarinovum caldicuralii]|uniref:Molybdopterin synthase catalytic subunit n=1 Tax=Methylomarinovum caldicuralii TaxID=438856 RepID=A0AAU9CTX1_9GAMM|nr:molybdenum cofactor biosynthesis protein MoaE [Methylomarinovum caldicuralii]BCX81367.1 molybdopterin synthase catalytic subunit [Methylomarinovum caldicuralii]
MTVRLVEGEFDPWALLQAEQRRLPPGSFGATACFVGTMRDFNQGDEVESLFLEHYPGMTERELERLTAEARQCWPLVAVLVVHRVGHIRPGEPIALVGVWSAHRREAFKACRWLMEALKQRAPFWKKEVTPHGTRWVEKNTPG